MNAWTLRAPHIAANLSPTRQNILEAAELVPMWDAPSARIECWRRMPEAERPLHEIKRFAYDMANELRKSCLF